MNTSKLIGLIPTDTEIKNINAKHRKIFAYTETARCLASLKDKSAEKFLDYAIFSIDELSKKEIGQRALVYAKCAEIYSIMGMDDNAAFYVNAAANEIVSVSPKSTISHHDKIIISIARAGVNSKNVKIVETAMKLCNNVSDKNYYISGLCGIAISYAHLGQTKKSLEIVKDAQNTMLKRQFYEDELGYRLGDIGTTYAKIGEIKKDTEIIAGAAYATATLNELIIKKIDEKYNIYEKKEPDTDFSYERKIEYTEYVVPNTMRIYVAEVNALLNIGINDYSMILIEGVKKFWNSGIMNECDIIKEEFFGPYTFRVFLDSARIFYKIGEKEKAIKILKFLVDYLFLEGFHIDYWYYLGNLQEFIEITMLLEELGDEDIRITDKIYDEIKDKDADARAAILSEILSSVQKLP